MNENDAWWEPASAVLQEIWSENCPPPVNVLRAVGSLFCPVDSGFDDVLDLLALPLFGSAARPHEEQAAALAGCALAQGLFTFSESHPDDYLVDLVLERRRGSGLVHATLVGEIGRRAGLATAVLSAAGAWFTGIVDDGRAWVVDPYPDMDPPLSNLRVHCGHEIGMVALAGLEHTFTECGCPRQAWTARALRQYFPNAAAGADAGQNDHLGTNGDAR